MATEFGGLGSSNDDDVEAKFEGATEEEVVVVEVEEEEEEDEEVENKFLTFSLFFLSNVGLRGGGGRGGGGSESWKMSSPVGSEEIKCPQSSLLYTCSGTLDDKSINL